MASGNPRLPVLNAHLLPYASTMWFQPRESFGLDRLMSVLSMSYTDAVRFAGEWMDRAVRSAHFVDHDIQSRRDPDHVVDDEEAAPVVDQCTRLYVLLESMRRILIQCRMIYLGADFNVRLQEDPGASGDAATEQRLSGFLCLSNFPAHRLRLETTGLQAELSWDVEFRMDHPTDDITSMTMDNGETEIGMHQVVVDGDSGAPLFIGHGAMSYRPHDIRKFKPLTVASADGLVKTGHVKITFATLFQIFIEVLELRGVKNALGILVATEKDEASGQLHYTLPRLFGILQRHSNAMRQQTLSGAGLEHRTKVLGLLSIGFVAILELQRYCGAFTVLEPIITHAYGKWIKALLCWDIPGCNIHNTLRNHFLLKSRLIHSAILHEHRAFFGDEQDRYVQGSPLFTEAFVRTLVREYQYGRLVTRLFQLKLPGMDAHLIASLAIYDAMYKGAGTDAQYYEVLMLFMQVCRMDHLHDVSFRNLPVRQFTPVAAAILARDRPDFSAPEFAEMRCSVQRAFMARAAARARMLFDNFFRIQGVEFDYDDEDTPTGSESSEDSLSEDWSSSD